VSRIGKGFGYVNFKQFGALKKALEAETVEYKNRKLRVSKAKDLNTTEKSYNRQQAEKRIESK
jgi:RNA recognition motif-containing protein